MSPSRGTQKRNDSVTKIIVGKVRRTRTHTDRTINESSKFSTDYAGERAHEPNTRTRANEKPHYRRRCCRTNCRRAHSDGDRPARCQSTPPPPPPLLSAAAIVAAGEKTQPTRRTRVIVLSRITASLMLLRGFIFDARRGRVTRRSQSCHNTGARAASTGGLGFFFLIFVNSL